MVFSFGGEASRGRSDSESQSFIWPAQAQFLQRLYGAAEGLFQQQQGQVFDASTFYSNLALRPVGQGVGTAAGVAAGTTPGQQFLQNRFSAENPYLGQQIQNYGADIARNLAENILPELRAGGVAAGAPGGSRAYIAKGMAADAAQREFAQGAQSMRANDLYQRTGAAQAFTSAQLAGSAGAYQGAELIPNLGMMPYSAAWMPALNMASILGGPTVLSRSEAESDQDSAGFNFGF